MLTFAIATQYDTSDPAYKVYPGRMPEMDKNIGVMVKQEPMGDYY